MKRILCGIDKMNEWSGKVVSWLLIGIIVVILYEIVVRHFLNAPTIWAHHAAQQMFGGLSILAGAYVLLHKAHIKIDVFYDRFPPRMQAIVDSITFVVFFAFVGLMLFYGGKIAIHSVELWEKAQPPHQHPVWPLKCSVPLAAFMILLQGLANLTRDLKFAITGRQFQ